VSRLLAGELRRLLARRLVRVLALLAVAGVALAGILVFVNTEAVSTAEADARRAAARSRVDACLRGEPVEIRPGRVEAVPLDIRQEFCRFGPPAQVDDPRFRLVRLKGILQGTTAPLVIVGWLIGASMIGADWQTRTLTTLLTWEPRRVRVILVKALACVIAAAAFTLLAQTLLSAALLPSALWHGTTAGADGGWLLSVLGVLARGTLLVSVATVMGFAVASIGRNTAAALGLGFAYFVIVENVVGSFLEGFRRWLLLGNAIVLVSGENSGGDVPGRSVAVAALFLVAVAAGLLLAATALFARRDVA
jgi:ABC-2 type transport system permease protein